MKRTRIIAVLLTAVMLLAVMPFSAVTAAGNVWDGTMASSFASGSGTEDDPYIITNGAELAWLHDFDSTDIYFELGNDIVLNDTSAANWYENAQEWPYISFSGYFDGKGHTISGLCVNPGSEHLTSAYEDVALFSKATGAVVANLNIEDAYIVGVEDVGGIIGDGENCTIFNCTFDGTIKALRYEYTNSDGSVETAAGYYAGGIIGFAWTSDEGESLIQECVNYGDVYAYDSCVGGIAGDFEQNVAIIDCVNYGNISGNYSVGGIAGAADGIYNEDENGDTAYDYANAISCVNKGTVSTHSDTGYSAGGIVGSAFISQIIDCYNYSDITAYGCVGGIVGIATEENTIVYSANYGTISGISYVGGISGFNQGYGETLGDGTEKVFQTSVEICVNHGEIIGINDEENNDYAENIGGITGVSNYGRYIYCYNYGDVSGCEKAGGIAGGFTGSGTLGNCYNNADVIVSDDYAGGIVGELYANKGEIALISCTNKGYIFGAFDVGGLLGYANIDGDSNIALYNSQNKGTVEGYCCVGGLGGYLSTGTVLVCLSDGNIIVDVKEDYCPCGGGLFGESGYITVADCISSGTTELCKGASFGGLINLYYEAPQFADCYYLETLSDFGVITDKDEPLSSELEGVYGISADEMKTQATFTGFDFESMWEMGSENPELSNAAVSILGDVDLDGIVDKMDYTFVKRVCFETAELEMGQNLAADVNGDGVVDKMDYSLIKRYCFGTAEIK